MKLTAFDLRALAHEMREVAAGLETVADAVIDEGKEFHYPDHAVTVQLFELLDIPSSRAPISPRAQAEAWERGVMGEQSNPRPDEKGP